MPESVWSMMVPLKIKHNKKITMTIIKYETVIIPFRRFCVHLEVPGTRENGVKPKTLQSLMKEFIQSPKCMIEVFINLTSDENWWYLLTYFHRLFIQTGFNYSFRVVVIFEGCCNWVKTILVQNAIIPSEKESIMCF